ERVPRQAGRLQGAARHPRRGRDRPLSGRQDRLPLGESESDGVIVTLRVVGAGVGRTGTASLKEALEKLLGFPCYHMLEVFSHPEHAATWHAAMRGEDVDWDALLEGYVAAVDW